MLSPLEIRARMLLREVTQSSVSNALGLSRAYVSQVVHGARRGPRVRRAIAEAIDMSYRQVWGESDPNRTTAEATRPETSTNEEDLRNE